MRTPMEPTHKPTEPVRVHPEHQVAPTDLLVATTQEHVHELPPLEEKDRAVFQWEVSDFFHAHKELVEQAQSKGMPNPAAYARAELVSRFVKDAEYKELGQLCNILVLYPIFAATQKKHDELFMDIRSTIKPTERSEQDALRAKKDEMHNQRHRLIAFNHLLRDFLVENGEFIQRSDLENWFARMNNNIPGPGRSIIKGIAAEVAVIRFIKRLGQEHGISVRPGTIDEDKKGIDIVVHKDGRTKGVDIKTGGRMSLGVTEHEEVNVDDKQITGFDLDRDGQRDVLSQLSAI